MYCFSLKLNSCVLLKNDYKNDDCFFHYFLGFFYSLFTGRGPQKKTGPRYRTPRKTRPPLFDYVYERSFDADYFSIKNTFWKYLVLMLKASWKKGSETPTFKCWYLYQTVKCQIIATNGWLSFHIVMHVKKLSVSWNFACWCYTTTVTWKNFFPSY